MNEINEIFAYNPYRWEKVTDFSTTVFDLLQNYLETYVTISDAAGVVKQYRLNDFLDSFKQNNSVSILTYLQNQTVFPDIVLPIKAFNFKKYFYYCDLFQYGLSADRDNHAIPVLNQELQYTPDLHIVNVSKAFNDITQYANKLLYLVNGEVFPATVHNGNVYLVDAVKHLDENKTHHLSLIDFTQCNGFEIVPFNTLQLTVTKRDNDNVYVKVAIPVGLKNKTLFIVINRRLYLLTNNYKIIDDEMFIHVNHGDLIATLHDLKASQTSWINPMPASENGFNKLSIDILQCLNSDGSFIVALNTNRLGIEEEHLIRTEIPFRYSYTNSPLGVMVANTGEILDYTFTTNTLYGTELLTTMPRNPLRAIETVTDSLTVSFDNSNYSFKSDTFAAKMLNLYTI